MALHRTKVVKLRDMRQLADELGSPSFGLAYPDALLIGCGILSSELPSHSGAGTLFFESQQTQDTLRQAAALHGRIFFLHKKGGGTVTLGRRRHNDIVIPDFPISSSHCYFVRLVEGMAVIDDNSTNGTFINHQRVEAGTPTILQNGDLVTVGRYVLRYFRNSEALVVHPDPGGHYDRGE